MDKLCEGQFHLRVWRWFQVPVNQGRAFLLATSLVIFVLLAVHGYRNEKDNGNVCVFNRRSFICQLLFFCTFVTVVTNLTFLSLEPYLPAIQDIKYLLIICLVDIGTAVIWLFVWALLSFFLLEQWIVSVPSSANVHSTRSIILLSFGGAICWVWMVMLLTHRLKEANALMLHTSRLPGGPGGGTQIQRGSVNS